MLFFAFMEKSLIFYACNLTCSRHNTPLFTSINWDSTYSLKIRDINPCLWLVDTECTGLGVVYRAIRCGTIRIPSCWRVMRGEHEPLCSPSPPMVTCLFEWKILERNPGEGVLSFSELVPNPFAERSCNNICSNQIKSKEPKQYSSNQS